jgi:phenylalanyl-tRNA synthetase beta chain
VGFDPRRGLGVRVAPAWFHPGRSGVLRLGPKTLLAVFGELHPEVLARLDVTGPVAAFEVYLEAVPREKKKGVARPALKLADLLPVRRDFAFVLEASVAASEVVKAVQAADKKLISSVNVFDVFEGASLGAGKKSLALEVTLQPTDKTLTDEEIEAVAAKVVAEVKKATGGEIRK